MAKLNIGLRIPAMTPVAPEDIRRFVVEAEALGFHSIWAGDHVFSRVDVLQPLQLLGWVSALTSRVRLGTAVMLTAYLNPVLLAKAAASLDCLCGGRLTLGLSIGGTEAEYRSLGVPMSQRAGRLLESVRIMRRLWQEDDVSFSGKYNEVAQGTIYPKPAQKPTVPIYFGATSDSMLARLGGVADGWVGSGAASVAAYLAGIDKVRAAAAAKGRSPDDLGFAKLHNVSLHPDRKEAFARAERHWKSYYGASFDVERNVVVGSPDECRERLVGFTAAACSEITLALEPSDLSVEQLHLLWRSTENIS